MLFGKTGTRLYFDTTPFQRDRAFRICLAISGHPNTYTLLALDCCTFQTPRYPQVATLEQRELLQCPFLGRATIDISKSSILFLARATYPA